MADKKVYKCGWCKETILNLHNVAFHSCMEEYPRYVINNYEIFPQNAEGFTFYQNINDNYYGNMNDNYDDKLNSVDEEIVTIDPNSIAAALNSDDSEDNVDYVYKYLEDKMRANENSELDEESEYEEEWLEPQPENDEDECKTLLQEIEFNKTFRARWGEKQTKLLLSKCKEEVIKGQIQWREVAQYLQEKGYMCSMNQARRKYKLLMHEQHVPKAIHSVIWDKPAILLLLQKYEELWMVQKIFNQYSWHKISEYLNSKGYNFTRFQVKQKFNSLVKIFKNIKDSNIDCNTFEYYQWFQKIIGSSPNITSQFSCSSINPIPKNKKKMLLEKENANVEKDLENKIEAEPLLKKRKNVNSELLEYMERRDDKFLDLYKESITILNNVVNILTKRNRNENTNN